MMMMNLKQNKTKKKKQIQYCDSEKKSIENLIWINGNLNWCEFFFIVDDEKNIISIVTFLFITE